MIRNSLKTEAVFLIFGVILTIYLISPSLNPFDARMFNFHDETQLGRITNFLISLKSGHIPPRIAPQFSFNLGFPVFNFYAPFAYWLTAMIALVGFSNVVALKMSFFIAVVIAFVTMYFFLRQFFDYVSSLLGASFYVTSTYLATEIVIRGNLAETWYLAILPATLCLITKNSKVYSPVVFFLTAISISFLLTVHNIFSLLSIGIIVIYIFLFQQRKRNFTALLFGLLLSAYFIMPAIFENKFTQANTLAQLYKYEDHFLCSWQLWNAHGWNFGGSLPGCDADQMSFKLGKIHLITAFSGLILLLINIIRKKNQDQVKLPVAVAVFFLLSLFMTLYVSAPVWKLLAPVFSLFQFPWRFLVFGMFGLAFFSGYLVSGIKINWIRKYLALFLIVIVFLTGRKYFVKPLYSEKEYSTKYNSKDYLERIIAYNIREYLPRRVDYRVWHKLNPLEVDTRKISFDYRLPIQGKSFSIVKNSFFDKKVIMSDADRVAVNIHYYPFWRITLNGIDYLPDRFDKLYRPVIDVKKNTEIRVFYEQTGLEKGANAVTLFSLLSLVFGLKHTKLLSGYKRHGSESAG